MPRSFSLPRRLRWKDPRVAVRMVLGTLLLANLAAAFLAFNPWGNSPEDLMRQQLELRKQLTQMQARLAEAKAVVTKVEQARKEGDEFLGKYVTERRSTFSVIADELNRTAKDAGIKDKGLQITLEPVEGSDTLTQMSISAGYEGTYAHLTKFVNLLDKSQRFLIIESMVAAPQQNSNTLNVSLKMDTFVREASGSAL